MCSRLKNSVKNKSVLITGGSRGLGYLLARRMLGLGARVCICARDELELQRAKRALERTKPGSQILIYRCDVGVESEAQAAVRFAEEKLGSVDLLINNASIMMVGPAENMEMRDFRSVMDSNFWGAVYFTEACLPLMLSRREGKIVNISSVGGLISFPHLLPYTAAKFAVTGLSMGLATELVERGIRVNTIFPGLMRTGSFLKALVKGRKQDEFNWFALGAALPIISMDAERAANQIVDAILRDKAFAVIGAPAKLGRIVFAAFPNFTLRFFSLINRLLPAPTSRNEPASEGRFHRKGSVAETGVTALGDRAAKRFQQNYRAK